jgi:hypothetical protein
MMGLFGATVLLEAVGKAVGGVKGVPRKVAVQVTRPHVRLSDREGSGQ